MNALTRLAAVGSAVLGLWNSPALGVVDTIAASAQASVRQMLPSDVVNSDSSFETLDVSTPNLPLAARAELRDGDPATGVFSSGGAKTVFSDPRASETENPAEFGADVAAFSLAAGYRYDADSQAVERRRITFRADEIGSEDGTALVATSYFFLQGFMAVWGDLAVAPEPTTAEVTIRVVQTRPDGVDVTVLDTGLTLSHNPDGSVLITTSGPLTQDNIVLVSTLGSMIPLGQTWFVVIPPLSIPYTYEATVGAPFILRAEVSCRVRNQPYTGAGITLGAPLEDFIATLGTLINQPVTEATTPVARSIGAPAKPLPVINETRVDPVGEATLARAIPCGLLGVEAGLLWAGFPMLWLWGRRVRPEGRCLRG